MALHTTVCFILLSLSLLLIHPFGGVMKIITSESLGGSLARKRLLWILITSFIIGYLRLLGQKLGLYSMEFGIALLVVFNVMVAVVVMLSYGHSLNKIQSEWKIAEHHLKLSEQKFSHAFTYSGVGMALVAPDGTWLDVNPAVCNILGYTKDELLKLTFQDVSHPNDLEKDMEYVRRTLAGEIDSYQLEKRYYHKGGEVIWARLTVSIVREADKPQFFISQIADITAMKSLVDNLRKKNNELTILKEKAECAVKVKSEFLANISHELRTPLNNALILSELLLQNNSGNLSQKQLDWIDVINKSGKDLLTLINDLLDLAKIESKNVELYYSKTHVAEIFRDMELIFAGISNRKSIEFKTVIDPFVPQYIKTDKQRLGQILKNLLSNAFKFTPQGGKVSMYLSLSDVNEEKFLEIQVRDSGIGIEKEKMELIFNAFKQADSSTTRQYGGTGLGLSISKELVELFGGSISTQSEVGKGSTFCIKIPLILSEYTRLKGIENANDDRISKEIMNPISDSLRGKKILVVDDNLRNVFALSSLLEEHGAEILSVSDGKEALHALLEVKEIAVILMDMMMPEIDGYEAMKHIRFNPRYKDIPVIALTAKAMTGDAKKCLEAGASDYISKPFVNEYLISQIEYWINQSKEKQEAFV